MTNPRATNGKAASVWRAPVRLPSVPLLRASGIIGKDLLRYWPFPAFLAVMTWGAILLIMISPQGLRNVELFQAATQFQQMLVVSAYAIGLAVMFEERESKSWMLFRLLPCRPGVILFQKLVAAILLLAFYFVCALFLSWLQTGGRVYEISGGAISFASALKRGGEPEAIMAVVAALVTGLALPLLLPPNLTVVAIAGPASLGLFIYAVQFLWGSPFFPPTRAEGALSITLFIWSVVMFAIMVHRLYKPNFSLSDEVPELQVVQVANDRVSKKPFDHPVDHHLRYPFLAALVAALFAPLLFEEIEKSEGAFALILMPVLGALIGIAVISDAERVSDRFAMYGLPISRSQIFWPRIRALAGRCAILYLAWIFGVIMAGSLSKNSSWQAWSFGLIAFAGLFSAALLGFLFSLFVRLKLVALILTGSLELVWCIAFGTMLLGGYDEFIPIGPGEVPVYIGWALIVMLGLPLLALYLAFCRSYLLETSEGRRGLVLLIVGFFLQVWGATLLVTSPYYLYVVIFG
ncbi:MAG: hypothetical protein K1X53_14295 [Candidatus Sumerlaeaceae bacterium]|nr:hypothetical protein [Candidatus Sumerlaeaceae bacterium]